MTTDAAALADNLLPCPFCGNAAETGELPPYRIIGGRQQPSPVQKAWCGNETCPIGSRDFECTVAEWNTRQSPAAPSELADKLDAIYLQRTTYLQRLDGPLATDFKKSEIDQAIKDAADALRAQPAAGVVLDCPADERGGGCEICGSHDHAGIDAADCPNNPVYDLADQASGAGTGVDEDWIVSMNHIVDTGRGADLRAKPEGDNWTAWRASLESRMKPTKRRKNIMSMLATGWLPWGVDWREPCNRYGALPLCKTARGGEYIMCCGHAVGRKEAQQFVDAGLMQSGHPDIKGRPTLVITDAGREWLSIVW